jgi:Glycosyltransferase family 17
MAFRQIIFIMIFFVKLSYASVYDCFSFYNELEILEIRLNELYERVDKFILVEATHTHKGVPKPLYFSESKERFAKFLDKIVCVVVDLSESHSDEERKEAINFIREVYQRNQIMRSLIDCSDDDIIFISDVDEIWRGECLDQIRWLLKSEQFERVGLITPLYFYFLDRAGIGFLPWNCAGATTYGYLKTITPSMFRGIVSGYYAGVKVEWKIPNPTYYLDNAGWHFTWMGGSKRVKEKTDAFAHGDSISTPEAKQDYLINNGFPTEQVVIDQSYPKYVQENIDYFTNLNFIYKTGDD